MTPVYVYFTVRGGGLGGRVLPTIWSKYFSIRFYHRIVYRYKERKNSTAYPLSEANKIYYGRQYVFPPAAVRYCIHIGFYRFARPVSDGSYDGRAYFIVASVRGISCVYQIIKSPAVHCCSERGLFFFYFAFLLLRRAQINIYCVYILISTAARGETLRVHHASSDTHRNDVMSHGCN